MKSEKHIQISLSLEVLQQKGNQKKDMIPTILCKVYGGGHAPWYKRKY